jgi:class 3 adenylate cyclase
MTSPTAPSPLTFLFTDVKGSTHLWEAHSHVDELWHLRVVPCRVCRGLEA